MDGINNTPLESLLRYFNLLESDFTVVSKVLHTSHLLLSNITLDMYPSMTAATSTPSSSSIQDSRSYDSAFNSSLTRIKKLSSMFSFLKSSPHIFTDSFSKLVVNKICSNNSISLNPIKNLPPLICRYFENLSSKGSFWSLDVKANS